MFQRIYPWWGLFFKPDTEKKHKYFFLRVELQTFSFTPAHHQCPAGHACGDASACVGGAGLGSAQALWSALAFAQGTSARCTQSVR